MLRDYNFDILKIDMSFVRKIETNTKTRSILRFLIDMAHEMGVSLIAGRCGDAGTDRISAGKRL